MEEISKLPDSVIRTATESRKVTGVKCLTCRRYPRSARRVINKSGELNINRANLPQKSKRFFHDFITTIIDARWRYVISAYLTVTFGCWTMFGMLWYLISYSHNDLAIDSRSGASLHEGEMTCVEGARTLIGFFLLSFEMQSTVGFGERYPNEECPEGVFMMVAQIVIGIALDGTMIAIIYAKLARPPKKPNDSKFSRKAVICQRDSKLCLMFRICDPSGMRVIDSKVQACLLGDIDSAVGKSMNRFQHSLRLQDDGRVLVLFPLIVCHVIDKKSPLYTLSAEQFLEKRFEVVITFTGTSPSTGLTTEERTSYLSKEIVWGHRFVNMMQYNAEHREYFVDYDLFDATEQIDTPLCSAEYFDEIQKDFEQQA